MSNTTELRDLDQERTDLLNEHRGIFTPDFVEAIRLAEMLCEKSPEMSVEYSNEGTY